MKTIQISHEHVVKYTIHGWYGMVSNRNLLLQKPPFSGAMFVFGASAYFHGLCLLLGRVNLEAQKIKHIDTPEN